jgi:hypothetical protein
MYQNFTVGYGGACEVYDPPVSPWCSEDFYLVRQFKGGGAMHTRHPSGIEAEQHLENGPYKNPEGAHVFAWRPGHWYTWMFEVAKVEKSTPIPAHGWTVHNGTNAIFGLAGAPKASNENVHFLGEFDSLNACWAACNATKIAKCEELAWHEPSFNQPEWRKQCYMLVGPEAGRIPLTQQPGVVSVLGPQPERAGASTYVFGAGGNQGGEGNDAAGEWFIENVYEELDQPNEYFFDAKTNDLHVWYNGTTALPPSSITVPRLANIFVVKGTKETPVKNITIGPGLQFVDTRPTYMEPRTNPSGGDWALERSGAVLLEGCESCEVKWNSFHHLDGNAVFLSGYNRDTLIYNNVFVWLGQNAIASWGYLDGETMSNMTNSGLGGLQPRRTLIERNWVHEIGHIQKQSSFYFQAITAETTIQNNVVFNIPRAGIK